MKIHKRGGRRNYDRSKHPWKGKMAPSCRSLGTLDATSFKCDTVSRIQTFKLKSRSNKYPSKSAGTHLDVCV